MYIVRSCCDGCGRPVRLTPNRILLRGFNGLISRLVFDCPTCHREVCAWLDVRIIPELLRRGVDIDFVDDESDLESAFGEKLTSQDLTTFLDHLRGSAASADLARPKRASADDDYDIEEE